jgi:hypothetical protein
LDDTEINEKRAPPSGSGAARRGLAGFPHNADNVKVLPARRLREVATMSLQWIARHLHTGRWTYVSNLLHMNGRN